MFRKVSIKTRITLITVIFLISCCIGLTLVLNRSAFKMTAALTMPSEGMDAQISQAMLTPAQNLNIEPEEEIKAKLEIAKAEKAYKTVSLGYMILFIAIGGGLMYFSINRALRPLSKLSTEIKNKSIENLSEEVYVSEREDEIHDLAISFNSMTEKVNEAFLMQKRFSNNAAHELRTPLTVMRTKLDVFKKRKNPNSEEYDKLIQSMNNQVVRLSDIVSSLLSLTNMEDMDLHQKINLKEMMETICNDLYFISEKKGVKINIIGKEEVIQGNYDLIYRAFYNLIENSIKYNNENGEVYINIKSENEIIIKDTGIGIPDNMKENIFEPFFTVDKSRSRKLGGAGIGLSIVKSILDKHNGEIIVSDNEDKGSIFTIKLKRS
ncbi:HAMP domain-containing sensor histidine kinase [uncultured Clostridium sp.]|uniref:sensor histidine kinase n=1 Tax=uncultured Clostridium sp. TaxID=59620 RepID=UPI00260FDD8F|nr:HAMP domain-containing sensor histidine kinase [uncultured Clostridium sp.]